jgi:hypothetical protein
MWLKEMKCQALFHHLKTCKASITWNLILFIYFLNIQWDNRKYSIVQVLYEVVELVKSTTASWSFAKLPLHGVDLDMSLWNYYRTILETCVQGWCKINTPMYGADLLFWLTMANRATFANGAFSNMITNIDGRWFTSNLAPSTPYTFTIP